MAYGTNSLNDAYANNLGQKASIINQQRSFSQANYNAITIQCIDSKDVNDWVMSNPKPFVKVISNDILSNGEIRRLTMMRSPS